MKASIQAVAAEAGVSISTVSRTFAKPNLVLPETRSKVMAAAEKLDYRISRSAAALKTGQSFRVALLMSDPISTWFNSNTYAGLDSVLHPAGYDISIFEMADAHDRHEFFATLPVRRNVDAVIEASFDFDEAKKQVLGDLTIPVVGMNAPSTHGLDAGVAIDDEASMATIVRFLKSLGHKTLAYIEQPINTTPFVCSDRLRKKGFSEASQACGYADEDIIVMPSLSHIDARSEQDIYSGIVAQLLSAPKQPTAICVSVDAVAAPLLKELRRMGWRVPQDVSLVGFDDDDTATALDLTTMHQDPAEIGRIAARKTLALLNGETLDEPFTVMPTSLVLRGTTERVS